MRIPPSSFGTSRTAGTFSRSGKTGGTLPAVLAGAAAAAILLSGAALAGEPAENSKAARTVTVSASGTVTAVPDMAWIRLGVVREAASAHAALAENSAAMTRIVAGLKAQGIASEDIQTSSLAVDPIYADRRDGAARAITRYRARNTVEITVRALGRLGGILDALVTLGVNQVDGLSFGLREAETLKDGARKAAMANARRRAGLLAEAGGASLGEVLSIAEDTQSASPYLVRGMGAGLAAGVPIERGTQELVAHVTVTWALK